MSRSQRNNTNKSLKINNSNYNNNNLIMLINKSFRKELNKASSKYFNETSSKSISKILRITLCNPNKFCYHCRNRNT